jgi:hypothetical protein
MSDAKNLAASGSVKAASGWSDPFGGHYSYICTRSHSYALDIRKVNLSGQIVHLISHPVPSGDASTA